MWGKDNIDPIKKIHETSRAATGPRQEPRNKRKGGIPQTRNGSVGGGTSTSPCTVQRHGRKMMHCYKRAQCCPVRSSTALKEGPVPEMEGRELNRKGGAKKRWKKELRAQIVGGRTGGSHSHRKKFRGFFKGRKKKEECHHAPRILRWIAGERGRLSLLEKKLPGTGEEKEETWPGERREPLEGNHKIGPVKDAKQYVPPITGKNEGLKPHVIREKKKSRLHFCRKEDTLETNSSAEKEKKGKMNCR